MGTVQRTRSPPGALPDPGGTVGVRYHRIHMPVEIDIAKGLPGSPGSTLTEEQLERYGKQLGDILEHAERVQVVGNRGRASRCRIRCR